MKAFLAQNMLISHSAKEPGSYTGPDPPATLSPSPPTREKLYQVSITGKFEKQPSGSLPVYNPINGTEMPIQHDVYGIALDRH
eukprot:11314313-Karenia_brevis.AAC.1